MPLLLYRWVFKFERLRDCVALMREHCYYCGAPKTTLDEAACTWCGEAALGGLQLLENIGLVCVDDRNRLPFYLHADNFRDIPRVDASLFYASIDSPTNAQEEKLYNDLAVLNARFHDEPLLWQCDSFRLPFEWKVNMYATLS